MSQLADNLQAAKAQFEDALALEIAGWQDWPETLIAACSHSLLGGGKRVRPILSLLTAQALGRDSSIALPWAMAVEMIHTYSLIHDDLPAMDDDHERRGRPTCHIEFGEANAILAGDALLTRVFGVFAGAYGNVDAMIRLVQLLADASGGRGMVAGQILDMGGALDTQRQIQHMQSLKTGALISAAIEGGAIIAEANADDAARLRAYGSSLGALFQITDDLLDREEDGDEDGKNLLNHLSMEQVIHLRDETAHSAKRQLTDVSGDMTRLIEFVDYIAHRTI
jgi:geranylgeranyl pyrophosphate synthase